MQNTDLTIIVPVFNREKYIKECLNSIFNQETSYSYHLIVADDNSFDNSVEIIKEYMEKFPDKITLLTSPVNQKLYKNVLRAYELTKTPYFTVLDPDDFWIDKNFIQKGIDFLKKNKDFSIYAANAYTQENFDVETRELLFLKDKPCSFSFDDFLSGISIPAWTGATIFKNTVFINGIPDKMLNEKLFIDINHFRGDTFRNILHIKTGKLYFAPICSAVYRQTKDGIYAGAENFKNQVTNSGLFSDLYTFFDDKYPEILKMSKFFLSQAALAVNYDEIDSLKKYLKIISFLELNTSAIEKAAVKKQKVKYKLYYFIYNKLRRKLKNKGII